MPKIYGFLVILLYISFLITPACAIDEGDTVNLFDFPQKLADALVIPLFAAKILASLIIMSLFLFPAMFIAGYFSGAGAIFFSSIIVGMSSLAFCVALGWFPIWVYIVICLFLAFMYSQKIVSIFRVGGSD